MSEVFVARSFWAGPTLGPRDPSGSQLIPISGQVHPSQGNAQAAGFVPVKADKLRDRFFPADRNGREASVAAVASLSEVPSDGDGWFTLGAEAGWWTGVDGVLVALLYDMDLGPGPFFATTGSRTAIVRPAWSPRTEKAMHVALENFLNGKTTAELMRGVVKTPGRTDKPATDGLTFVLASCQYPAGLLDQEVAEASYARLALTKANPRFLLLVGDQVYVDATAGLFDPTARFDRFALPHNNLMRMLTRLNVLALHPYTMLDDHEIEDNWEPVAYETRPDPNMVTGREYYLKRQRLSGPVQVAPAGDSLEPLWYMLPEGFFVADTRTERTPRTAETIDTARIMSRAQFEAILSWLPRQTGDGPKFIASPSILLPRRLRTSQGRAGALRSDAWDGYPWSLNRLLAYIVEKQLKHVVFLSGDEHLCCVVRARITAQDKDLSVSILSVHSSALYAPFPFANCVRADLAYEERFEFSLPKEKLCGFEVGGNYRCEITEWEFFPGDGFAVLSTARAKEGWNLRCVFDRAPPTPSKSVDYDF